MLASKLLGYKNQNCAVVALSPGSIIVGAQIAMRLHASLFFLMMENVSLPGESDAVGALTSEATFTYNNAYSPGQIEEMVGEYHHFLDQQRLEKFQKLNRLVGLEGEIDKDKLRHHVVIAVTDGLANGFSLDVAAEYLKTVAIKKLVIASPIASIPAVDRMHLVADEICCLSVTPNYMFTDHYYDENTIPAVHDLFKVVKNISLHWQRNEPEPAKKHLKRPNLIRPSSKY